MRTIKTVTTALALAVVVTASLDYTASAATGHSFILGQLNKANRATVLKRTTAGPALQLTTAPSAAPLVVNGQGKVTNLNADLVDGMDATALTGVRANVLRYSFATSKNIHEQALPILAPGAYLASLNVTMIGASGTAASPSGAYCELDQGSAVHGVASVSASRLGWDPTLSSTTVISTADGNALSLYCSSTGAWTTAAKFPAEVTFTKLDGASIGATIAGD